ncbi:MAG TPA: copper-binding protein, partial [Clostridia bacterium]|nr:copper-binding protein [Clostridia bacterium]
MNHLPCVFAAVFVAALVVSCGEAERSPGQRSSPGSLEPNSRQVFTVTGVVVALDPGGREVRIRHEEIPGYMQAMTMPFDVKDTNELSGLAPGDHVIFRLTVTETEGWIDQVQKTGAEPGSPRSTGPERETEAEPLEIGDAWPAYVLTNQFGEAFSTASLRGRTVALSFIFT